jgi:hypothetical protein
MLLRVLAAVHRVIFVIVPRSTAIHSRRQLVASPRPSPCRLEEFQAHTETNALRAVQYYGTDRTRGGAHTFSAKKAVCGPEERNTAQSLSDDWWYRIYCPPECFFL